MVTFTPELDYYKHQDDTHHIYIRITMSGKHRRISTGHYVKASQWDRKKRQVNSTHPLHLQYNADIKARLFKLESIYLQRIAAGLTIDIDLLKQIGENFNGVSEQDTGISFFDYAESRIALLPSPNSRDAQRALVGKFRKFLHGRDLKFHEITAEMIAQYRIYLEKTLKNSPNTIHNNITKLKTIYNEAIKTGVYEHKGGHPFILRLRKTKSRRTRLTMAEIELLEQIKMPEHRLEFDAINTFLFSFYMQGIRVGDLLQLTWDNVKGDYLYYRANKTGKARPRLIVSKAKEILYEYAGNGYVGGYIFPWLNGKLRKSYSEEKWAAILDSANSLIRKYLKKATEGTGIGPISMHVARHSFADIARKTTGDVYKIKDALDHGDISTTENYFSDGEPDANDDFVRSIFGE